MDTLKLIALCDKNKKILVIFLTLKKTHLMSAMAIEFRKFLIFLSRQHHPETANWEGSNT